MPENNHHSQVSYGRIITAACFSLQAVGVGILISYGVFFNSLIEHFGWSRASIAGASSAALFTSGVFGILVGRLNDRFGPRTLMGIASVLYGLGFCMVSQINTILGLYLFMGFIFGLGYSAVDVIALTTIARWYSKTRGKMTGLVKVGTGAGQFTFPILASFLIATSGWQNAFIIIGSLGFVLLFAISRFLKRDPGTDISENGSENLETSQDKGMVFSQAVKTPQMWLICMINMLLLSSLMSIMIHIVPHARDIGISPHKAAGVLSTIGLVSMLGRFVSGMTIDRTGSKMIMAVSFLLLISSLSWLLAADQMWKLYVFACVYGISHGSFFTAISPIMVELFGIRSHGSLFGVVMFFGTTGGSLGPILYGWLFDLTQSYRTSFMVMLATGIIGLVLLMNLKATTD